MIKQVLDETNGLGVDIALEMVGINSSLNNALKIVRRGGHVVLFGVRNGDIQIEDISNFKNKNFMIDLSGALEDGNGKKDISKIDKLLNLSAKI